METSSQFNQLVVIEKEVISLKAQDIQEMLYKADIKTDILSIAYNLLADEKYSKQDAGKELVEFLNKHGFNE